MRKPALVAAGAAVYGAAAYLVYSVAAKADPEDEWERRQVVPKKKSREVFDRLAKGYDRSAAREEYVMGMGKLRRRLVAQARGDVLEVAAGTGRNLEHYDGRNVGSLLLVDHSPRMLERARRRHETLGEPAPPAARVRDVRFAEGDAERMDAYADDSFDTVVDTFGLCSFEDPVGALREFGRLTRPGGRILLLEHGESPGHGWLNWILQRKAVLHARHWGCFFNRSIPSLVREAGLRVEKEQTHHWGTTHVIVARGPRVVLNK